MEHPLFGTVLKEWRHHRRMSQLELSSESGISQRHISFLETGRSQPSRGMVLALAESLDVPIRERNALLSSAGFTPRYRDDSLDDAAIELFREALSAALEHHEPYPAIVLDGRWNMVMANSGALNFFGQFIDLTSAFDAIGNPSSFQIVRLCLSDRGLKPFIENWQELIYSFLQRARRSLVANPKNPDLAVLIEEIVGHPQAPANWQAPDWSAAPQPAVSMVMATEDKRYALFTMLGHFGGAEHVTLAELSLELFYPADDATRTALRKPH